MQQTQAQRVLSKWDGDINQMAAETGHPYKRIWNWLNKGAIPQDYHQDLLNSAAQHGRDLHPFDFVAHLHRPVVGAGAILANTATG